MSNPSMPPGRSEATIARSQAASFLQLVMNDEDSTPEDKKPSALPAIECSLSEAAEALASLTGRLTPGMTPSSSRTTMESTTISSTPANRTSSPATDNGSLVSSAAPTPVNSTRKLIASFEHPMASLDDPAVLMPSIISRVLKRSDDGEIDRAGVFPHNFDYARCTTRDQLMLHLDPNNPRVNIDLGDFLDFGIDNNQRSLRKINVLRQVQDAARQGYDNASEIDHESGKTNDGKSQNVEWNKAWTNFLNTFNHPILKGAAAVGYRAAKRAVLANANRLHEFCVCDCESEETRISGCTTNQYRSEAFCNAISNHFGRNKNNTKVADLLMPTWCRKHYQRAAYNDESWQRMKRDLIICTIDRTQSALAGPRQLTYEIKLRAQDMARIIEVARNKGEGGPREGQKHATALDVIQTIDRTFCGAGKSAATAKALAQYAHAAYETALAIWKNGKSHKDMKNIKSDGPKYPEFELVPEWSSVYTREELAAPKARARESLVVSPPSKGKVTASPSSRTPNRTIECVQTEDDNDDDELEGIPSLKKQRD